MSDTFREFAPAHLRAYVGEPDEMAWEQILDRLSQVREAGRQVEAGLPDLERNLRSAKGEDANSWYHRQREHMGRFMVGMLEAQIRWSLDPEGGLMLANG